MRLPKKPRDWNQTPERRTRASCSRALEWHRTSVLSCIGPVEHAPVSRGGPAPDGERPEGRMPFRYAISPAPIKGVAQEYPHSKRRDSEKVLRSRSPEVYEDIKNIRAEAEEEGYPVPPDKLICDAERLAFQMFDLSPKRFEVYPTPDGELAIDVRGNRGSVVVLCEPTGGALCLFPRRRRTVGGESCCIGRFA